MGCTRARRSSACRARWPSRPRLTPTSNHHAGRIWFGALADLSAGDAFLDLRAAMMASADRLYGREEYYFATATAFAAVNVGPTYAGDTGFRPLSGSSSDGCDRGFLTATPNPYPSESGMYYLLVESTCDSSYEVRIDR